MGIVFRQSAKNAIVVVSGAVLGAVIMWLSAQYIPDKHKFGFTQDLTVMSVIFAQIMLVGLSSTLSVYIHRFVDDENKRKVLITLSFLIPGILIILASVFYFLFRSVIIKSFQPQDIPLMQRFYGWLPVYTLLFMYQLLMEQYLSSQMKVAIAGFIREVVIRLLNIILLSLFAFHYITFDTLVAGIVLVYIVSVAVCLVLSFKTPAFGFSLRLRSFNREEYKDMVKFSWYHFLLNAALMFMAFMDMMLLPFYDKNGFGSVATYRISVFLIVVLSIPAKALMPASFTDMARAFNDKNMVKAKDIFTRSSINILIPTVCIAVLLFCNLRNVVAVIQNNYSAVIPVFSILFIGNLINIGTGMNDQVLSIANYYKFNFYLSLFLIVVLYILLRFSIPRYGIYGAAWSNTITVMLFNIIKYLFIRKKVGMQPFTHGTLLIILAGIPALAAGYYFPYFFEPARHIYVHTFLDAIMRSFIIVVVYVGMLLWLKPSPDLQEYILSIRKNKRLF